MAQLYTYNDIHKSSEASLARVTVGIKEGMFRGSDHLAIQAAVDYAARFGGGTVTIGPGQYTLRNAVFLPGNVSLVGSGDVTHLQKHPTVEVELAEDMDWYAWHVVVKDATPFIVGDGITIRSQRQDGGTAPQITQHTIVAIEGNRLLVDSQPRVNHWLAQKAKVVSTHSLIEARQAQNLHISRLLLDGNREKAANLDGNYVGAIFLHDCERVDIRNVTIRACNGDAISWQIVHDVTVEDCTIDDVAGLGMHPGSGSQRPIMRRNTISNCMIGIFWCWGVKNGIAEANDISDCSRHGISTGHRDTDNRIIANCVRRCGEAGIEFREERSAWHTSHRVLVEGNEVEVPAEPQKSVGIHLCRGVEDVIVRNNVVRVPHGARDRAVVVDPETIRPVLEGNRIVEA